jgi:hypothetical protein
MKPIEQKTTPNSRSKISERVVGVEEHLSVLNPDEGAPHVLRRSRIKYSLANIQAAPTTTTNELINMALSRNRRIKSRSHDIRRPIKKFQGYTKPRAAYEINRGSVGTGCPILAGKYGVSPRQGFTGLITSYEAFPFAATRHGTNIRTFLDGACSGVTAGYPSGGPGCSAPSRARCRRGTGPPQVPRAVSPPDAATRAQRSVASRIVGTTPR